MKPFKHVKCSCEVCGVPYSDIAKDVIGIPYYFTVSNEKAAELKDLGWPYGTLLPYDHTKTVLTEDAYNIADVFFCGPVCSNKYHEDRDDDRRQEHR